MTTKHSIKYNGIILELSCIYNPKETTTLHHPGFDEEFYIEQIFHKGDDITRLLCDDILDEIKEQLIIKLNES